MPSWSLRYNWGTPKITATKKILWCQRVTSSMKKGKQGVEVESERGEGKGCLWQDGMKRPLWEGGMYAALDEGKEWTLRSASRASQAEGLRNAIREKQSAHMMLEVLRAMLLWRETPWGGGGGDPSACFQQILQVSGWVHVLTPHSGLRFFFFTFNLHGKLERNELHPPGFLCSVQLRKAIS